MVSWSSRLLSNRDSRLLWANWSFRKERKGKREHEKEEEENSAKKTRHEERFSRKFLKRFFFKWFKTFDMRILDLLNNKVDNSTIGAEHWILLNWPKMSNLIL